MINGIFFYGWELKTNQFTQGRYTSPKGTHRNASDWGGEDQGVSKLYCPKGQQIKCIAFEYDNLGTSYSFYEFQKPITLKNGNRVDKLQFMCLHGFGIDQVGNIYNEGEAFYDEGVNGNAYGNHVHIEFGTGYYGSKNDCLKWEVTEWVAKFKSFINIEEIFYFPKDVNLIYKDDFKQRFIRSDVSEYIYFLDIKENLEDYKQPYKFISKIVNCKKLNVYGTTRMNTKIDQIKAGTYVTTLNTIGWSDDHKSYIHNILYEDNDKQIRTGYVKYKEER